MIQKTDDLRIVDVKTMNSPESIFKDFPLSEAASETVYEARQSIYKIINGEDDRLLVVVGPCSIHDVKAAIEYAEKLNVLRDELSQELFIVMRVYFEKPRTTVGWKGLINDPDLDDSYHINKGVKLARELLLKVNEMGLPAGTEYLDLISPQYISDLVSWGAIGARTTESQGHRELASGLSCPVGFKNGTTGSLQIAIDAIGAASQPHNFMSLTKKGHSAIFCTSGNEYTHVILRGGSRPNYDRESINHASDLLTKAGLQTKVMVDCSHANSQKQFQKQVEVCDDIAHQLRTGQENIFGLMIESHLVEGRQNLTAGCELTYGQSVTDACIGWQSTETVLRTLADAIKQKRAK
ncbi:MAG: 3-deoxy-7-phosphoheptulonate synthase [Gammaproteobacteria bacterium]|nr:3-deoxy-7-phosphoheptulonate synthase [Gammaproteobacteria bacterium]